MAEIAPHLIGAMKLADDMYVVKVQVSSLKEQDVNAQVLQPRHFERLTENIRARGMLESLPYCHQPGGEGPIEIISGHHRVRAARAAGLAEVPIILDTRIMKRSEIVSKVIAHNELHGQPDEAILKRLVEELDNVDDLLASGLSEDWLPVVEKDPAPLLVPHAEFDWRLVSLVFLPHQMEDITKTLDMVDKHSEIVGLGGMDQFQDFSDALVGYSRLKNIRSMAMTFAYLSQLARDEIKAATEGPSPLEVAQEPDEDGAWVNVSSITDVAMAPGAAFTLATAIRLMMDKGDVTHAWQALEYLAAEYLAGAR